MTGYAGPKRLILTVCLGCAVACYRSEVEHSSPTSTHGPGEEKSAATDSGAPPSESTSQSTIHEVEATDTVTSKPADCATLPDFTPCELKTGPERSFDVCVDGSCVSPGCGDVSCNLPGPHFPLPDTGQRTCYDDTVAIPCPSAGQAFYGQDAQYGWDLDHAGEQRFTRDLSVSLEPVIHDTVTGLVWQGCLLKESGDECESGYAADYTWSEAIRVCESLGWAGFDDWRLPDPFELATLVHHERYSLAIEEGVFLNAAGGHWTSATDLLETNSAWGVSFSHGWLNAGWDRTATLEVRCVRGGAFEARQLTVSHSTNERVVNDSLTHLVWQGCPAGLFGVQCEHGVVETLNWSAALAYCEGLSLAGRDGWRLPNRFELMSLLTVRRIAPAVSVEAFPATPSGVFWSSTTSASTPEAAWTFEAHWGETLDIWSKTHEELVRCVRDAG